MNEFCVKSFSYNEASDAARKEIAAMLNLIWPEPMDRSNQGTVPISHRPELSAQSFCCYANGLLVSYAGVVQAEISHLGAHFRIAGLSCVATLPQFQGRGFGSAVIRAATKWIEIQNNIDFGIFTCQPNLAIFYQNAGAWETCPNAVLLGSHEAGALSSEALDVIVLMRLFSEKAEAHKALFCREPISLNFPMGEFL